MSSLFGFSMLFGFLAFIVGAALVIIILESKDDDC